MAPFDPIALDLSLLEGFGFECRPDCGLCCFATPAVTPPERPALLQIQPSLQFENGPAGIGFLPSRPNGGACVLLRDRRCTAHAARPFPCRTFPLSVHLGASAQATLVLSCPGLDLASALRRTGAHRSLPTGLDAEIAAAREELAALPARTLEQARRGWDRALRGTGWVEPTTALAEVRESLARRLPTASDEDVESVGLPPSSGPLETLPMFFDAERGDVALGGLRGGAELVVLAEAGGVEEHLASYRTPARLPAASEGAQELLDAYLRFVLRRDAWVGAVLLEAPGSEDEPSEEQMARDLRLLAATVCVRGAWRQQLAGGDGGHLTADDVVAGIRATDAEWLDRPTAGRLL